MLRTTYNKFVKHELNQADYINFLDKFVTDATHISKSCEGESNHINYLYSV